jgi:hypothetical protein
MKEEECRVTYLMNGKMRVYEMGSGEGKGKRLVIE